MLPTTAQKLVETQLGVVARFQLLQHLRSTQIEGLLGCGYLEPVQRGVYRVRGGAAIPDQVPLAAALRARDAQITGPFVLSRLRLDGFTPDAPFEVLVRPDRRLCNVDFPWRAVTHFNRPGSRIGGVRLAGPADALVDSGRFREVVGDRQLRLAYDQLRWRNLLDVDRFTDTLERLGDDLGAAGLQQALGLSDLRSEAEGERTLGGLMSAFRPAPEPQVWVTAGRRADWFFRALRLAIEYLGWVDHAAAERRRADAERNRELVAAGIRVETFTAADLLPVEGLLAKLAAILTLRARELGTSAPVYAP